MAREGCKNEKHDIKLSAESARIVADMMQEKNRLLHICGGLIAALVVAFVIMAGCMAWTVANQQRIVTEAVTVAVQQSQDVMNEALLTALNTVAEIGVTQEETTTTTTQTVEGDNATINNGEWEQYNDSATKYEGAE